MKSLIQELGAVTSEMLEKLNKRIAELERELAEERECCTKSQEILSEYIATLERELAEARRELRDTTWQNHSDYWQKRCIKAEKKLAEREK